MRFTNKKWTFGFEKGVHLVADTKDVIYDNFELTSITNPEGKLYHRLHTHYL
jgi:hypothetical protein